MTTETIFNFVQKFIDRRLSEEEVREIDNYLQSFGIQARYAWYGPRGHGDDGPYLRGVVLPGGRYADVHHPIDFQRPVGVLGWEWLPLL